MKRALKLTGYIMIIYIIGGCSITQIRVKESKDVKIETEQHDEFRQDSLRINVGGRGDWRSLRKVPKKKI